ncbi:hypothetical protein CPB86DRAFT_604371 [Serendipita vermifera]|nr:hypothetical protein CPB86DRAFT_604371 [Serendipita vermifera]
MSSVFGSSSIRSCTSPEERRISKIKKDLRFIRIYPETKRVSTSTPPNLEFVLLEWPIFCQPLDFATLIDCAKREHLSSCDGRFHYGLVHSRDRKQHLQPRPDCPTCLTQTIIEKEVMTYLQLVPQAGGHLNEYSDYWSWEEEFTIARVVPGDRELVECAAKFVRRCIEVRYEELGLSHRHMVRPFKASSSKGKKRKQREISIP